MSNGRTRVTIAAVPLVIQPAATDIDGFAAAARAELVSAISPDAEDRAAGQRRFEIVVDGWLFEATTESATRAELRERVAKQAAELHHTSNLTLRAQIPGRIIQLWVAEGETVERGQRLLAIEAMKMENEIRAPQAGVVEGIEVDVGARIERGDALLTIG